MPQLGSASTAVIQTTTTPASSPLGASDGCIGDGTVVVVVSGAASGIVSSPAASRTVVVKAEQMHSPPSSVTSENAVTTIVVAGGGKRLKSQDSQSAAEQAACLSASFKKLNRFSEVEKSLLYAQFREHQQIIDIKQRRSSYSSHKQAEVRACWERIVDEYNAHPDTQNRTMRQIQKFWLNSK